MQSKNINILFVVFLGYFLIILAGFRPLEFFMDTSEYIRIMHDPEQILELEPTFWLINIINMIDIINYKYKLDKLV